MFFYSKISTNTTGGGGRRRVNSSIRLPDIAVTTHEAATQARSTGDA